MARDDPVGYEEFRREIIENFIDNAPERLKPRLRGIQFRVDCLRQLSTSSLGATVRIYELMWGSFLALNSNWQEFVRIKDGVSRTRYSSGSAGKHPARNAQVLQFPVGHRRKRG